MLRLDYLFEIVRQLTYVTTLFLILFIVALFAPGKERWVEITIILVGCSSFFISINSPKRAFIRGLFGGLLFEILLFLISGQYEIDQIVFKAMVVYILTPAISAYLLSNFAIKLNKVV